MRRTPASAARRSWLPLAAVAAVFSTGGGCEREPLPTICPDVQEGELVVTELRGPQTGSDTYGQWIELFNPGDGAIDLLGLQIIVSSGDGSEPARLIVRETLELGAGEYAVLGRAELDDVPAHMDYGFGTDFDGGLDSGGVIEVEACEVLVDRLVFTQLVTEGSYAFDGAKVPTATANDDTSCWCADATDPPPDGPMTEIGLPGSPGEENRPCI